jgi:hypothetical protein
MIIEPMPGCCTSAVLHSLGEHGEYSVVNEKEINRLCAHQQRWPDGTEKTVLVISVDPRNQKHIIAAGFKEIYHYEGIQGVVRYYVRGPQEKKSYDAKRNSAES